MMVQFKYICTCSVFRNQKEDIPRNWWWEEKKAFRFIRILKWAVWWQAWSGLNIRGQIDIMKNDVLVSKKLHQSSYLTAFSIFTSTVLLSTRFRWNNFKLFKLFYYYMIGKINFWQYNTKVWTFPRKKYDSLLGR